MMYTIKPFWSDINNEKNFSIISPKIHIISMNILQFNPKIKQ